MLYRGYLTPHVETLDAKQAHAARQGVMETVEHVPGLADVAHAAFAHSFTIIAAGSALVTVLLAAVAIPLLHPSESLARAREPAPGI